MHRTVSRHKQPFTEWLPSPPHLVSRGAEEKVSFQDETAATAVEYGVLVALTGAVLVAVGPRLADAALQMLDVVTGSMLG